MDDKEKPQPTLEFKVFDPLIYLKEYVGQVWSLVARWQIEPGIIGEIRRCDWKFSSIALGEFYYTGYVEFPDRELLPVGDDLNIDVHGGVTLCCEVDGVPTYGFDTAHYGDVDNPVVLSIAYVRRQVIEMSEQIKALYEARQNDG